MKHYKIKHIPATTTSSLDKTTCDLCGAEEDKSTRWPNPEPYDFNEVTISHEHGSRYPEGGYSQKISLDICPTCFKEHIIPALEAIAKKKFEYKEIDW
jgi:hypothetical protein